MTKLKFKVGDELKKETQSIYLYKIIESNELTLKYKLEIYMNGRSQGFQTYAYDLVETVLVKVEPEFQAYKPTYNDQAIVASVVKTCSHTDKYVVRMQSFKSFWTCPNCKADLGDA